MCHSYSIIWASSRLILSILEFKISIRYFLNFSTLFVTNITLFWLWNNNFQYRFEHIKHDERRLHFTVRKWDLTEVINTKLHIFFCILSCFIQMIWPLVCVTFCLIKVLFFMQILLSLSLAAFSWHIFVDTDSIWNQHPNWVPL